ncbi:16970_t:CDS:2 [Gigaspora margarita]|uniref:16970_t:CDS:1 n=1 Tax=Gigaspora margarita TaxID=4874 RepID=A0ABM8VW50_GIGMA|nr:16970_t:CDS:2 [Gigaspora margarita]
MFDLSSVESDYSTFINQTKNYLTNCLIGNAHLTGEGSLLEYFDEIIEEAITRGEIAIIEYPDTKEKFLAIPRTKQENSEEEVKENLLQEPIDLEFQLLNNSNEVLDDVKLLTKSFEKRPFFFMCLPKSQKANPKEGKMGIAPHQIKAELHEPTTDQRAYMIRDFKFIWTNMERAYGIRHDTLENKEERASVSEVFSSQSNFDASEKKIYRLLLKSIKEYNRIFEEALGIVAIVAVMVFKYFLKINRENIVLGQHDKEQSQRITTLEKKNGNEQHQIDELKKIVKEQGERIEQLERPKNSPPKVRIMNKTQLQKEILEKVKEGVKPSDLKKQRKKNGQNKNNVVKIVKTSQPIPTPPITPKSEQSEQKNSELLKKITELQAKINEQDKTIENLKNQPENKDNNQQRAKKTQPQASTFTCEFCYKQKEGQPTYAHVENMPDKKDSREISRLCSYCSYARAKKTNFYCPRFNSGRDVWDLNTPEQEIFLNIMNTELLLEQKTILHHFPEFEDFYNEARKVVEKANLINDNEEEALFYVFVYCISLELNRLVELKTTEYTRDDRTKYYDANRNITGDFDRTITNNTFDKEERRDSQRITNKEKPYQTIDLLGQEYGRGRNKDYSHKTDRTKEDSKETDHGIIDKTIYTQEQPILIQQLARIIPSYSLVESDLEDLTDFSYLFHTEIKQIEEKKEDKKKLPKVKDPDADLSFDE